MDVTEKANYVRANRASKFKVFDAIAIRYLSQGLEIPANWQEYATNLREMTENIDDSKVELVDQMWLIHWPPEPS